MTKPTKILHTYFRSFRQFAHLENLYFFGQICQKISRILREESSLSFISHIMKQVFEACQIENTLTHPIQGRQNRVGGRGPLPTEFPKLNKVELSQSARDDQGRFLYLPSAQPLVFSVLFYEKLSFIQDTRFHVNHF